MEIILRVLFISFLIFLAETDESSERCFQTSCDCFDEFGDIEYQCPNSRARDKMVIRKEYSQSLSIECWNVDDTNSFLPNITFATPQVTIAECPVTLHMGSILNIQNVTKLKLENTKLVGTSDHLFRLPMRSLIKLSLKAIKIDQNVKFDSLIAPKLTSIELEEMDMSIGAKIFKNLTNLLEINLSFNDIDNLQEDIFRNLSKLEILHLSKNKIEVLEDKVFENLFNLRNLLLDFNDIQNLNNETFKDLKRLDLLDLSNNNIQTVQREVFKQLKLLRTIYLDHNEKLILGDCLFSDFSKLETVFLGYNNLKHLPETLFRGSRNINHISLENNHLTYLPRPLFKGLDNLKILNLHNNHLRKLDGEIFKSLGKLKTLELHYNQIPGIDSNLFQALGNLQDLTLNNNEISYISNDSFKNNQRLEKILMGNNKYVYEIDPGHYFSVSPFSSCKELKELDLSNNLIKDVLEDLIIYSKQLRQLNLKGNKIENVDISSLWKLANKGVILNLEHNNITHFFFDHSLIPIETVDSTNEADYEDIKEEDSVILISHNPLNCDCFAETFLDLILHKSSPSHNYGIIFKHEKLTCSTPKSLNNTKFSEVSPKDLACPLGAVINVPFCTSLGHCQCSWRPHDKSVIVDCARKNLTEVPHILIPISLDFNQTEVHLEGNMLNEGPTDEQMGYRNVTKLYLSGNQISSLSWLPPNIEVLDLSNNKMQNLNHSELQLLNHSFVRNVTLGHNPWACRCENWNLTKFIRRNIKKVDAHSIKCKGNGSPLADLTRGDLCLEDTIFYMIMLVFLSISLCVIFITLAIYYKYSQEIKIWLYSRNMCLTFLQEEELDKNKKYDVFISYSHKDEDFVVNNLVSELEKGPHSYKLCLHYRDWIPGDFIIENISYSVMNSKRTLVVLTPNFLESVWGKMEFRTAHTEAMKERRSRVILVVKGNINIDELDPELKTYLRTNTYVKWQDAWFWEKLKYALPHKRIAIQERY